MTATPPETATRAVIAIGANLGQRFEALQGAVDALGQQPGITVISVSSVYETDPIGGPEQPVYLNAVLSIKTSLPAHELLAVAHEIEAVWLRTREVRWGARSLDIDIITYGDFIVADELLTVPHPRARDREFVLVPWLEIEAAAILPGVGPVAGLSAALPTGAVRRTEQSLSMKLNR